MAGIEISTYIGTPLGMNVAKAINQLDDQECRFLVDALLHEPTLIYERGPISQYLAGATGRSVGSGAAITAPDGSSYVAFPRWTTSGTFHMDIGTVSSSAVSSLVSLAVASAGLSTTIESVTDLKPLIKGQGYFVGFADASGVDTHAGMWAGGKSADYSTGTIQVARGSTSVTGSGTSWTSNVTPGMFLVAQNSGDSVWCLIGIVASVNSNTSITLESGSLHTCSAANSYYLTSFRGIHPRVVKGRITVANGQTTVTGGGTKFTDQGMGTGTWYLYKQDGTFIGKVSSVSNNTSLTLAAGAAVACANDRFIAMQNDPGHGGNDSALRQLSTAYSKRMGYLTASYASRQFYACRAAGGGVLDRSTRVWYSDPSDPEGLDLSEADGDHFDVTSTQGEDAPIVGLAASFSSMLIMKETETFGLFGTSPTSFSVKKLEDDGALGTNAIVNYQGGVIWAGRKGIYYYDGTTVENVSRDKLGDWYIEAVRDFNPASDRMWGQVIEDHYFLHISSGATPPRWTIRNTTVDTPPTQVTIVLNLQTRAFSLLANCNPRGVVLPPDCTVGQLMQVTTSGGSTSFVKTRDIFNTTTVGVDSLTLRGESATGPSIYLETKKFDAGDPQIKKLFKQIQLMFSASRAGGTGNALTVDTVLGLGESGNSTVSKFQATHDSAPAVFRNKRIKFLKRSQYMAVRIYKTDANVKRVTLGPFAIGFKYQRPGKV